MCFMGIIPETWRRYTVPQGITVIQFYILMCFIGIIPETWRRYTVPQGITVIQWITDFSSRVKQLQKIVQATQQGGAKELKVSLTQKIEI